MKPYDEISIPKQDYQTGWLDAYEAKQDGYLWKEDPIEFLPEYSVFFKEQNVHSVLDTGCGDGRNSLFLLSEGFSVTGMDLSLIALKKTLHTARLQEFSNVCLIQSDIESLPVPFPSGLFDALVCLDVFGQVLNIEAAVSGFRQVVKKDGFILLNLYTPDDVAFGEGEKVGEKAFLYRKTLFRFFTAADVESLFEEFKLVDLKRLRWEDPPHPGYRDYYHTHDSYVVLLQNPGE